MTLEKGAPFVIVCLTLCLSVQFVSSVVKDVYFNGADCSSTISLNSDDQAIVKEKPDGAAAGSSVPDCEITFRANDLEGRLCIDVTKMTFSNNNLQLDYYDKLTTGGVSDEKFNKQNSVTLPHELCSTGRYAVFHLASTAGQGNFGDVDFEFAVRHISSTSRVVYMDSGCSKTHHLESSTITVKNRHSGISGPATLPGSCNKVFEYNGQASAKIVCLTYMAGQNPSSCGFSMKVLDGPPASFTHAHTYNCSQSEPSKWCGKTKVITLELTRTGSNLIASNEPDNLFTLQIEDKAQTSTQTSTQTPGNGTGAPKLTPLFLTVIVILLGVLRSILC